MTEEQYNKAQPLIQSLSEKKSELGRVNDLLANATGNTQVKINTRWIVNLPSVALKGFAQQRKVQLQQEISDLETQLGNL